MLPLGLKRFPPPRGFVLLLMGPVVMGGKPGSMCAGTGVDVTGTVYGPSDELSLREDEDTMLLLLLLFTTILLRALVAMATKQLV